MHVLPPPFLGLCLQKLEQFDLSSNSLEGPLPSSWSSMTGLKHLWADVNKLTGPLPASWSGLQSLEKLVLSENSLEGALPPSWSDLKALAELWLEYNQVGCSGRSRLGRGGVLGGG
jgi:Leucine-rich repeat (LRR) protein